MDADPNARFYDGLAEVYHLVYADWERSVAVQGEALAGLVRERWPPARRVLDAACGIGTQALGLAAAGLEVVGSDVSAGALARARREAARRGLALELHQADLRALGEIHRGGFDVVLACDNALPHLPTDAEILQALRGMRAQLRPGGGCVVSARDYAAIEPRGTRMLPYGVRETPAGRVCVFQVWDFVDPDHYDLAMYFVHETPAGPRAEVHRARYYAIPLDRLAALLREAGFGDVERLDDRFFQPLLVGTNPTGARPGAG